MYLDNKYTKWYNSIINNGVTRNLVTKRLATAALGYCERHHITPKSLGGDNSRNNLVYLTAREHFVCHLLLTKMTTGVHRRSMVFALTNFTNRTRNKNKSPSEVYKITARTFQRIKEQAAMAMSAVQTGRSSHFKGRVQTPQNIAATKLSNSKPCISPDGTLYTSTKEAGIAEGVTSVAIRARIRNQVSGWKYVDQVNQETAISKKLPSKPTRIGRKWWNNGHLTVRSFTSPGDGFILGRPYASRRKRSQV